MEPAERSRLMEEGRRAFNRGEFYEAHEFWEDVWNEVDDPDRLWIQGMIQIATGLHKLQRERPDICRTLFEKGLTKLADAPEALDGYALKLLREDASRLYHVLARGEKGEPTSVKLKKQA